MLIHVPFHYSLSTGDRVASPATHPGWGAYTPSGTLKSVSRLYTLSGTRTHLGALTIEGAPLGVLGKYHSHGGGVICAGA